MLHTYYKSTPFIASQFSVDRCIFLEQSKQAYIVSDSYSYCSGHNSHFILNDIIKSAIGEWIERASLINNPLKNKETLNAINLITGEKIEVSSQKILFKNGNQFNDSCGVGSHLDSFNTLKSAFLEFFERQSLIFHWITKTPGKRIDINEIDNERVRKLYDKSFNFIDELFLVDISLHNSLNVIFSIGIGKYHKALGLSASWNFEEALIGSLEELFQSFGNYMGKKYIERLIKLSKNRSNIHSNKKRTTTDLYKSLYDSISIDDFRDEYKFLWESNNYVNITNKDNQYTVNNIASVIKNISKDLGINIFSCFIPALSEKFRTKIIKVFSPEGYPHMYPVLFNKEQTEINFNKKVSSFPNAYRAIPFP